MTETETKWSERVREWKASGRTAPEFAEGRDFKASTLVYWARRQPGVRMARVVPRSTRVEETIVIVVGAARVAVRQGFDGTLLRQVVRALGDEP